MEELIIKGLNKVNEFADPELLDKSVLTRLENMVLDSEAGKATKRGGFSQFNTNSAGAGVYSLHDLVDSSGNNVVLGVVGTAVKKSSAGTGTWSNLKTGLTSNLKTFLATYNNKHFISNGANAPFVTDLTSVWDIGITAPVITNVVSTHAAGGNLTASKWYRWIMVYATATGEYSPPSKPFTHYVDLTTAKSTDATNKKVRFDSLPVSGDSRVISRLIYRTEGDGNTYYLIAKLDNTVTYFEDNYPDTDLDYSLTVELIDNPTLAKYPIIHKERLFFGYLAMSDKNFEDPAHSKINSSPPSGWSAGYASYAVTEPLFVGSMTPGGTYKYRLANIDSAGKISSYIEFQVTLGGSDTWAYLGNLPTTLSADQETRLYRTKAGLDDFYYLATLQSGSVGFWYDDSTADASLTVAMPSQGTTVSYKSGVIYSEIAEPSAFPVANLIQVYPDDGDEITGMIDYEDSVIVIKKNSLCRIRTIGSPINWVVEKVYSLIGSDQQDSVQRVGAKIYFMNNKHVYRFPDAMELPLSKDMSPTFNAITTVHDSFYSGIYQWYVLVVTISSSTKYLLIYDEKLQTWYKFSSDGITWECGIEKLYGSSRGVLIFGNSAQQDLSKYDTSAKIDTYPGSTAEITCWLKTKTFTVNDPMVLKRPRILLADYKKRDDKSVVHLLANPQDGSQVTNTDSTNSAISSDYKNYKKETDGMTMTGNFRQANKIYYQISGQGLDEFNGAKLKYRLLDRGRRG